jgi:hypothetical protein
LLPFGEVAIHLPIFRGTFDMKTPHTPESIWGGLTSLRTNERYGLCSICGAIFSITEDSGMPADPENEPADRNWLSKVVLLDLDDFNASGGPSLRPVMALGGGFFQDAGSPKNRQLTCHWDDKYTTWDYRVFPRHAAFHPVCWDIANRVATYLSGFPSSVDSGPSTIDMFVQMLEDRDVQNIVGPLYGRPYAPEKKPRAWIPSPVDYYGDIAEEEWGRDPPPEIAALGVSIAFPLNGNCLM